MSWQDFSDGLSGAFNNQHAFTDFFIILLTVVLMFGLLFAVASIPGLQRKYWEKDLYKFLGEFKELSPKEHLAIDNMVKKYKLKTKYRIFTSPASFEKYMNLEIISIEESHLSGVDKEQKVNFYIQLKKKLFYSDNYTS